MPYRVAVLSGWWLALAAAAPYGLLDRHQGSSFFDGFDFYTGAGMPTPLLERTGGCSLARTGSHTGWCHWVFARGADQSQCPVNYVGGDSAQKLIR